MKVSTHIVLDRLKQVMRMTVQKTGAAAIVSAVRGYWRKRRIERIVRLVREGTFNYGYTNDELEAMVEWRSGL